VQATSTGSDINQLRQAGVAVETDADQYHMHHKFAIVDQRMLANGSFNWTRQAVLYNQENVVITDNAVLVGLIDCCTYSLVKAELASLD